MILCTIFPVRKSGCISVFYIHSQLGKNKLHFCPEFQSLKYVYTYKKRHSAVTESCTSMAIMDTYSEAGMGNPGLQAA